MALDIKGHKCKLAYEYNLNHTCRYTQPDAHMQIHTFTPGTTRIAYENPKKGS